MKRVSTKSFALAVLAAGKRLPASSKIGLETFEIRVGFGLDETRQQLIGIFQVALVFDLHVFADGAFGERRDCCA